MPLTQRRFETAPGEQAQVDWGQWKTRFGEVPVVVHVLVMTLDYSRRAYCEGFLNEQIANVLAAHERAGHGEQAHEAGGIEMRGGST